ncbi:MULTISPECIES: Imm1 family immunity protein [Prauserella salsuginis group]|uniref:Imm1 family immunity protein n=1 Tax=Prauserella salsuginis TaxID=387889 RepID=A0ABW6G023_9PSEU|nr:MULTISPECIES: Imm1 family immunity protein [Prauserella salsuginis group]MCR3721168.1 Immunity protein Imm1 [Prauserella flava]MCR3734751.1 Immunity protein Imm1 [Prauserella salsuginis]
MTLQAQYWVHQPGQPPVEKVDDLATPDDVRAFMATLAEKTVSDAILTHTARPRVDTAIPDDDAPSGYLTVPDHSVIAGIHGDRGALSYRGNDGHGSEPVHLYSHGDGPERPVLYETDEFPPNCEIPASAVAEALIEFLDSGKRPLNVAWQSETASVSS